MTFFLLIDILYYINNIDMKGKDMNKDLVINIDEEVVQMVENESQNRGISVSAFFEKAVMIELLKSTSVSSKKIPAPELINPVRTFAEYLTSYLEKDDSNYEWTYEIHKESLVPWLDEKYYKGSNKEDSEAFLDMAMIKMREAIDSNNEQFCFEVVRLVMDWGGVYYDFQYGPQKGNEETVKKLYQEGTLLSVIIKNSKRIQNDRIERLDYYTSGWAIVWYILHPDKIIIMGSREVFGLNKILMEFKNEKHIEKLPRELDFGQLVYKGSRRYIPGIKYVYTTSAKMKMIRKILNVFYYVKEMGNYDDYHSIDRKLFMLGK